VRTEKPTSGGEAGQVMRAVADEAGTVRAAGGRTKIAWGPPVGEPDVEISTERLDRVLEHNPADLTAVVQSGVRLADAQAVFSREGQMLALDPPLGAGEAATLGGVVATADSGPLHHRYGTPRDLLLGITVALSDGTVARAGGKVIKNVAGYDLAKLFAGSFGTLGVVVDVAVRLHPKATRYVTAAGSTEDSHALQRAASLLAHAPLEIESLDVAWERGGGSVLARFGGAAPEPRAADAVDVIRDAGLDASVVADDEPLWELQRRGQRSGEGAVLRVSALPADLHKVLDAADRAGASVVGRAGLGVSWLSIPPRATGEVVGAIEDLRRVLHPAVCVVLDAPRQVREEVDVWGVMDGPALELMRRVKTRFDPAGVCNRGLFVGGI
jgi:glycolate oxidase FAD binding subunit